MKNGKIYVAAIEASSDFCVSYKVIRKVCSRIIALKHLNDLRNLLAILKRESITVNFKAVVKFSFVATAKKV